MAGDASVLLRRHRLHEVLDGSLAVGAARLTVISGPSGFGKTSLARAWISALAETDIIWVTVENDLESRSAFWQTVLAAATRLGLMGERRAGLLAEVENSDDPAAVIARGLHVRGSPVLVVDAYEKARGMTAQVDADLVALVQAVPQLRVVVTTRTSTGLASPARSLRGDVRLLTQRELAFTLQETRDLLATFAAPGPAMDAEQLHAATHGYPLALRAALLSPARATPRTTTAPGWRALVAEDLRAQLEQRGAYDFVLATSVPPYFDAELALELFPGVGDHARVKELLDELEWDGFGRWIPFAPGQQVFQYVESLRDAVLVKATDRPERVRLRAAESSALWLLGHGSYEAALEIAVEAGLFGIAARVYAGVVATNQDAASASLVDRHLASVPSSALTQYPALAFGRGLTCYRDPALRSAAAAYFAISAAWERPRLPNPTAGEYLLGHVARTVSLRLLGRTAETARAATAALTFHDALPTPDRDQVAALEPMVLRNLGYSLFLAGQLDEARAVSTQALAAATDATSRNHTAAHVFGVAAFEGWLAQARSAQALIAAAGWRPGEERTHLNVPGLVGRAVLSLEEGDFAGALAAYGDCPAAEETSEFWPMVSWTRLHAHLGLGSAAAEAQRVELLVRRTPAPPGMGDSVASAALRGALAVCWLAAGNGVKAAAQLRRPSRYGGQLAPATMLARLLTGDAGGVLAALPRQERRPGHTVRSRAALLTVAAAAAARMDVRDSAVAMLERAFAQVGPEGSRLHLMHLPVADLTRLRAVAADLGDADLRAHLAGPVAECFSTDAASVVVLSAKERMVLAALVDHPTRTAVARALHVSENTVKTHLQRIYRKLGVGSRGAALERALELDLLHPVGD